MSLSVNHSNSSDYFRDALNFLETHQWIYNFQNTHILVNDTFAHFPCDWPEYFRQISVDELNKLPVNDLKNCPTSLSDLLDKIKTLSPTVSHEDCSDGQEDFNFSHNCGLSDKKRHEIVSLAPIVNQICAQYDTHLLIDVGSGLGYLSHYLNSKYHYKILGVECSGQYVQMAYKNQEKFHPKSKNDVTFTEHYITGDSCETIKNLVRSNFNSIGFESGALVGLHACADLSITILDIFCDLDFIKSLVIMPCCYHRIVLEKTTEDSEYFRNFPISVALKNLFKEFDAQTFLKRPFLRLACQQTVGNFIKMSQEDHAKHSRNLMFRCILQEVAVSENCEVKRLKRKSSPASTSNPDDDFELYLKNLQNTHSLISDRFDNEQIEINDDTFLKQMRSKWMIYKEKCYLMEALTGLQSAIQKICENVILLDRVEYLREKGFSSKVQKVTNDVLSPRCYALIATKDK